MSKLILCSGRRTNRPYVLPTTSVRIYSIEELCYYIYNNIYFIDETLLSDSLINWISSELCLPSRAEKLEQLKRQGADFKTLLALVLCSSDYYTEEEIKKLLMAVDEIRTMPSVKRHYIKANSYLKSKQYVQAAAEYERILSSEDAIGLSPESYGDILHNLAIAKLHIYGPERALDLFMNAYERNHREESLRQYLYTLWMCNDREEFDKKIEEYKVDYKLRDEIVLLMEQLSREAHLSKSMLDINILRNLRSKNKLSELHDKCLAIIERWMSEIRTM